MDKHVGSGSWVANRDCGRLGLPAGPNLMVGEPQPLGEGKSSWVRSSTDYSKRSSARSIGTGSLWSAPCNLNSLQTAEEPSAAVDTLIHSLQESPYNDSLRSIIETFMYGKPSTPERWSASTQTTRYSRNLKPGDMKSLCLFVPKDVCYCCDPITQLMHADSLYDPVDICRLHGVPSTRILAWVAAFYFLRIFLTRVKPSYMSL